MSVAVGTEIAGTRLTRELERGGMAVVYVAEELATGDTVVVKVLKEELAGDERLRRRFVREARYASSLDHPHVVRVRDAGEQDGAHYIVMDYVRGADLRSRLAAGGPLEPAEAIAVLAQVADALDAAHAGGLLHRDVKPGNVLIASGEGTEPRGHCYLADFGLSKDPGRDSRTLTVSGQFVGSVLYAAPEQILAEELDARADVYALGCVLYECLVGAPPFVYQLAADVMRAHVESPAPKPSKERSGLPPRIDAVVARALAKEPAARYATCGELIEAAREALDLPAAPLPRAAEEEALTVLAVAGDAAGQELELRGGLVLGEWARVIRSRGGYLLEGTSPAGGTFLNGQPLEAPRPLRPGDAIAVGGSTWMVRRAAGPRPGAVSLRVVLDFEAPSVAVRIGGEGSDEVRVAPEGGRWRTAAG